MPGVAEPRSYRGQEYHLADALGEGTSFLLLVCCRLTTVGGSQALMAPSAPSTMMTAGHGRSSHSRAKKMKACSRSAPSVRSRACVASLSSALMRAPVRNKEGLRFYMQLRMFSRILETDKEVGHPHLMPLVDVIPSYGPNKCLAMVMPKYACSLNKVRALTPVTYRFECPSV